MQRWIVLHKKVPVVCTIQVPFFEEKVFDYSDLHFSEVTSYKIYTLAKRWRFICHLIPCNFSKFSRLLNVRTYKKFPLTKI